MAMAASNDPHVRVSSSCAYVKQAPAPETSTDANCSAITRGSGVTPGRGRRYTHNPYASQSATPSCSSANTSRQRNSSNNTSCDSSIQFYNSCVTRDNGGAEVFHVNSSLLEQFLAVVGDIPRTACTLTGRHLLVSVLRLQHMDKLQIIIDELLPQLNIVALDPQGCHVVRTLFEIAPTELMETVLPHFAPETVIELAVSSQHTRRVLQSIFERHKSESLTPIVTTIAQNSQRLAVSQQGCIAVISTIENSLPHQQRSIISMLLPVLPSLTMNCYGNYVVQCLLQHMDHDALVSVVCNAFAGHWLMLSRNKFASNVIEKVVWQLDGAARRELVNELVMDTSNLRPLMQDGFGNFVLQAIIDSSSGGEEFREISSRVRPLLHTSPYGHKIGNTLHGGYVRSRRVVSGRQAGRSAAPLIDE
ncbi:pumilio protein 5 [Trypanosoma conorhini]|uniref:Pumilio protein 5 n=1 Tax=Trypanosoma conorhini TaxID=83891 RepID=A0A3R7S117_9TRYP|nr:pumilio protein 5 [Trypanosoma conorhini]RNF18878.1 pumilio protein 5 [Trypanosoma conorhini]